MPDRKRILVTGATGLQGGSVALHLLRTERYRVRCLTRDPAADRAANLKQAGAEVVAGDMDDLDSLKRALHQCWGAFGVTSFWEHFERERDHGRNLCDAVADSHVEHFVFSTLPSAERISSGELHVPHLDIKAELEDYARELKLPATFVHVAFYYRNFVSFFPPQRQDDGTYVFGFPQGDTPLAAVSVEDVGGVVLPMFQRPDEFRGRTVGIVGDHRPPAAYAEIMTRVLGRTVRYEHVPREQYAQLGFPGAEELATMFEFNRRFIPDRTADLAESRRLFPEIRDFETWLKQNRARFDAIMHDPDEAEPPGAPTMSPAPIPPTHHRDRDHPR